MFRCYYFSFSNMNVTAPVMNVTTTEASIEAITIDYSLSKLNRKIHRGWVVQLVLTRHQII